jgi:cytochrome c peroxidase
MKYRPLVIVALAYAFMVYAVIAVSNVRAATLSPFSNTGSCRLPFDIQCYLPGGRHEDPDVARENQITYNTELATLAQIIRNPPRDLFHQVALLGKAELYDSNLSANKNLACATCHAADSGFTNASSHLGLALIDSPGSVKITNVTGEHPNFRIGNRRPQTYGYAPYMQVLHYDPVLNDFYGANFWDMRATGLRLGNPAAEQAEGPPTNPNEMALSDTACLVYDLSRSQYASFFVKIWGAQSFAIHWPQNVGSVCAKPGPPPANDPYPVHLSAVDRGTSNASYDHFAEAMAAYEASPEVSPFSSKYDAWLAGKATLTAPERHGYSLFNGKAICSSCHSDGAGAGTTLRLPRPVPQRAEVRIAGVLFSATTEPLFTDETSSNLGLPKNDELPYLYEDVPDQYGFTANPLGPSYKDLGVGAFLSNPALNPNPAWAVLAPQFNGKFQVPTLRNVDKRPRANFVKAYMHNGYLHSLEEVVHFYNTRDKLPHCLQGSPGEKVTCWPMPEVLVNEDKTVGNLGLNVGEEADLVAFLKTLTDGYVP